MNDRARLLAELAVPRYTSYPTAPQFSSAIGADRYASWLATLPQRATLSLYLHVPYCSELCHYCGCHTKAVRRRRPIDAYVDQLMGEIALVGHQVGGGKVVHLHWGGGTPSIVGAGALADLVARIIDAFEFGARYEHAIEL